MSTEVEQFQLLNISYKTPTKNVQKNTQQASASPKSLSTNDNSFEREQHQCKEPDDILENLLSFFEYQVLTPFTSELYSSNIALEETRRIFGTSLSPQNCSTSKSASDLTISESKVEFKKYLLLQKKKDFTRSPNNSDDQKYPQTHNTSSITYGTRPQFQEPI